MSQDDDKIRDVFRKKTDPPGQPTVLEDGEPGLVYFPEISCRAWEHPADRAALTTMRKVPGFDLLLRRMSSIVTEPALRSLYLGNAVRVSEKQFPDLNAAWIRTCKQFDADRVPELFVTAQGGVNAAAVGWDRPFVYITAGALKSLKGEEIRFVLAHELSHVLSGHALYRTMMDIIVRYIRPRLVFMPAAWLVVAGIELALKEWSRKSELSCDRAGLLAVQDIELAQRIHMKMAGGGDLEKMNVDAFREQAAEYEEDGDLREQILRLLMLTSVTHPFPVLRLAELSRWAESGEYQRILDGHYPRRSEDDHAGVREDIARTAETYKERWSEREDALGKLVQDLGGLVSGRSETLWEGLKSVFRNQGFGGSSSGRGDDAGGADDGAVYDTDVDAGDDAGDDDPTPGGKTL